MENYTLLVAPARYSVVQLMMDVIDQRPSVLAAYQSDPASPGVVRVDAWNGRDWLPLRPGDLEALNFVRVPPARIVLIGDNNLVPKSVLTALESHPGLIRLLDLDNASLVNDLDPVMKWNRREWAWFAARYNLQLEDEAAAFRNASWYDQPGPLRRPASGSGAGFAPAPKPAQPVVIEPVPLDEPVREEIRPIGRMPDPEPAEAATPTLSTPPPALPSPRLSEPLPGVGDAAVVAEPEPAPVIETADEAAGDDEPLK